MGVGGQHQAPAALPPERPSTHCIGGWVIARPVCTGADNLAPHRDSIPGRPVCSESLYRLRYPGPQLSVVRKKFILLIYFSP
jgi:hypothetical protein